MLKPTLTLGCTEEQAMTADEYERILCPTEADFKTWTADLFCRAVLACRRVDKLYPNLGKNKTEDEPMPLFESVA